MRHAAAALVVALASSAALAQDQAGKEMESQSDIADRTVAEQQGLKLREVEGVMTAPARAFSPIEGGDVQAPGGSGDAAAAAAAAEAEAAPSAARKAKHDGGIPWGIVAGALVSLAAVALFVRAWRRAA
jgi:hypothetical protein